MHPLQENTRRLVLFIFILSGLAGLIYESIWSHYLKLFLGHAAYSQALVLAIFMGGMTLGAWLVGKHTQRISNPLAVYAWIEAAIGVMGFVFHDSYLSVTDFAYDSLFSSLDTATAIQLSKWGIATLLVLPQSILLGATFPLMSAGLIRLFEHEKGRVLASLYFANSLGAATGVLIAGFVLIDLVGLPGTVLTAALVNMAVALLTWKIVSEISNTQTAPFGTSTVVSSQPKSYVIGTNAFLLISLITGLSSFIYEIGWVRMLSLVLGSSTHSFELMLSAFIFGLALGGYYIRNKIDRISDVTRTLGLIQLLMGTMAALTLLIYLGSFDFMKFIMGALNRTESGYSLYILISHFISFCVMVPVTVLAGMTLPLITFAMLDKGCGEKAIGQVYAANTLGAIVGALGAALILMPLVGLKWVILIGAILDVLLGVYLLKKSSSLYKKHLMISTLSALAIVSLIAIGVKLEHSKLSSGVYRHGQLVKRNVEFYKDGKTASIAVALNNSTRSIITNGKVDAGASTKSDKVDIDEYTMILTGALPILHMPDAKRAAVIGMGSGITAHVALTYPNLTKVDIIEIEQAVVEGAKFFGERNALVYNDTRADIVIDDAKSYFSSQKQKYDLIISEPSNPWVSGVATLFSDEFYSIAKRKLNKNGLFVQWLQIYESDPLIVSSILKAISNNFADYFIYRAHSDLIIIASPNEQIPELSPIPLKYSEFSKQLDRIGLTSIDDVVFFYQGNKATLGASLESIPSAMNSDYFPLVDQIAAKHRFMRGNMTLFEDYQSFIFNLNHLTRNTPKLSENFLLSNRLHLQFEQTNIKSMYRISAAIAEMMASNSVAPRSPLSEVERLHSVQVYTTVKTLPPSCTQDYAKDVWGPQVKSAAISLAYIRSKAGMAALWKHVPEHNCFKGLSHEQKLELETLKSLVDQDFELMRQKALALIGDAGSLQASQYHEFAYAATLYSLIAQNHLQEANTIVQAFMGERTFNAKTLETYIEQSMHNAVLK